MINFSYLHQPGHYRNPKNPLTLQTSTLQWEQRKKVPLIMVQCCHQYHFTFYYGESRILQIGDFLYFAGKNIFWDWSTWFLQAGIYFLTIQPFLYKLSHKYRQTNMWKHCENEMISTSRAWDKKKSESPTVFESITSQTLGERSIHFNYRELIESEANTENNVGKICCQLKPKFLFCLLRKIRAKKTKEILNQRRLNTGLTWIFTYNTI